MAMNVMALFGVPLARVRLPDNAALKQQFLPEILRRYEARSYATPSRWESDRIHTSYGAEPKDQVIAAHGAMPPAYDALLRQFITAEKVHARIWHSVYWKGQEYEQQRHELPYHLSFMHFLAFDSDEHKVPVFYDPARAIRAYCRHSGVPPEFWEDKTLITVEEGDVLIFPSYLEHHIAPGTYTKPQVTVSIAVALQISE